MRDGFAGPPGVLEPARPDLGVGPAVDPALAPERRAQALVVAQVAVVAEREPAGRVVERLGVRQGQRRQPRRPPQVDERGGRLGRPDPLAARIVAKGTDVAVRLEPAIGPDPGRAPAEAGDPESLQPLGERPQLVEPERLRGPGDEVLTHVRPMLARRPPGRPGTSRSSAGDRGPVVRWRSASRSAGTGARLGRRRTAGRPRGDRSRSSPASAPPARSALASSSRRAVATSRASVASSRSATGANGETARSTAPRSCRRCRCRPAPRWSTSASATDILARAGSRSRRSASAPSNSGARRSGPSRPSDGWSASARCSRSSTTGASKQTATAPGTSRTSRATGRRSAPRLARPVAMPRPVHPQMRPDLEAIVEANQEVLAERLDGRDLVADDPADLRHRSGTTGPRRTHLPAEQVRPQSGRRPKERVAFGHARATWRRPGGSNAAQGRDSRRRSPHRAARDGTERPTSSPSTLRMTSSRARPSAIRPARARAATSATAGSSAAGRVWRVDPPRSR